MLKANVRSVMKKTVLLVTSLALVSGLASCANGTGPDNSSSEGPSSSIASSEVSPSSDASSEDSSSSSDSSSLWTEQQEALLKKYCGSVLPYPHKYVTGEITLTEQYDSSMGRKCLAILNQATSFTLKEYYNQLEEFGWTTVSTYNGDKVQTRSNTEYVELTKASPFGRNGYEMLYYFASDDSGSYNCILCYNSFSSYRRGDTYWGESDLSVIDYVTTTTLPYIPLGEDYAITAVSENQLYMYDFLAKDLSKEYADILIADGYELDERTSREYNAYYLSKIFDNGIKIEVLMQYFNGNNFYVYFTPKITEFSSWPSELINPIEESSGVSIPEYSVKEGGKYKTYNKHGVYYIYTDDYDDEFDYYGYIDKTRSELFCWDETLSFSAYILRDDDYNNVGFVVYFSETTPSRTFSSSWPGNGIKKGVEASLNVTDVNIPDIDLSSYSLLKDIKYEIKTQKDYDAVYAYYLQALTAAYGGTYSEEQIASLAKDYADSQVSIGVNIFVYDSKCDTQVDYVTRYKINEAYKEKLYNEGWYKVPESWGNIYEDPTGQIRITITNTPSSDIALTKISIAKGSGEAHEPTFKFAKENYEMGIGGKLTLKLETNMIPYDVSYSSSDERGYINVDSSGVVTTTSDAKVGDQATISASYTDKDGVKHSTSCTITIVEKWTYKTSLDKVEALLASKGYSSFTREDLLSVGKKVIGEKLTLNLGSSLTLDEAKNMVKEDLIPEEFISSLWEKVNNDDDEEDDEEEGLLMPNINNRLTRMMKEAPFKGTPGVFYANKTSSDLEKLYCFYRTDYSYLTLTYYVYTDESGNVILYVEAC